MARLGKDLPVSFRFSDRERDQFTELLLTATTSPFTNYEKHLVEIKGVVTHPDFPERVRELCQEQKSVNEVDSPFAYVKNCPIDPVLPEFGWDNPVHDKRVLKKTFVAEGVLSVFALLLDTPIICHLSANEGDAFHDIRPMKSLASTQSQKSLKDLHFHKDFVGHYARPDYVYNITLNSNPANETFSTFVRDIDVINSLPEETREAASRCEFHTPVDDIAKMGSSVKSQDLPPHALIENGNSIRIFESKTRALNDRAEQALQAVLDAIHANKLCTFFEKGDAMLIKNNYSLHARELGEVRDEESLKKRWMVKTHNVKSYKKFEQYFMPDRYAVVNG